MSNQDEKALSPVEGIKARSDYLRGSMEVSLADPLSGGLAEDDTQLSKFHGFYQQDDRDIRAERTRQKLEPDYSFMVRVRVPGGICTPEQWLTLDRLARTHANGTLRLTTRQAFQLHGVLKDDLKTTIAGINESLLDTIAACGDVVRNVMCTPLVEQSELHREANAWACRISGHLTPATSAYHEIWLNGKKAADSQPDQEPIYGATYLPRKFKIAVAVPPRNDVEVFAHDLSFIAIERYGKLIGFNVTVGGGMGMSHGEPATYPRLGNVLGFCTLSQVLSVAEHTVTIQRDFGDRSDRKHARLKYTIDDHGLDWFRDELKRRTGFGLLEAAPFEFDSVGDQYGWLRGTDDCWHLTLFLPSGRVVDSDKHQLLTGLREIARQHRGEFRLTPNQNLIVSGIEDAQRPRIEAAVQDYGLDLWSTASRVHRNALACVALPTCGQAMAEAERYLPSFVDRVAGLLDGNGLTDEDLHVRITGCPNGCARPYLADIGLVGKAPGRYSLYLGGGRAGTRLNRLHLDNAAEDEILTKLGQLLTRFADERDTAEPFSDFLCRTDIIRDAT